MHLILIGKNCPMRIFVSIVHHAQASDYRPNMYRMLQPTVG